MQQKLMKLRICRICGENGIKFASDGCQICGAIFVSDIEWNIFQ
jgi:ribosomal protein L37E